MTWWEQPFTVLDTETTSTDPEQARESVSLDWPIRSSGGAR